MTARKATNGGKSRPKVAGFSLPRSRPLRIAAGVLLVLMGLFGFLPVLGFWMIPLGLAVLSVDLPRVRRFRRKAVVAWRRRRIFRRHLNETT